MAAIPNFINQASLEECLRYIVCNGLMTGTPAVPNFRLQLSAQQCLRYMVTNGVAQGAVSSPPFLKQFSTEDSLRYMLLNGVPVAAAPAVPNFLNQMSAAQCLRYIVCNGLRSATPAVPRFVGQFSAQQYLQYLITNGVLLTGSAPPVTPFTGTLVQFKSIFASGGVTAAITMDAPFGNGNLLVIMCQFETAPYDILSVDAGGVYVPVPALQGADPSPSGMAGGYVYPSVAGGPVVTLTFAGSTTANFAIWEIAPTAGVPALDVAVHNYIASGTSPSGQAAALSSSKACVFVAGQTKFPALVTAINAPYNPRIASGQFWGEALNVASFTTPQMTTDNSAISSITALAFGASPLAFKTEAFCDFEAGTDGADCTSALLTASTYGWKIPQWTINGPGAAMKFASAASMPALNDTGRLNDGGSRLAGVGNKGVRYLTSSVKSFLEFVCFPGGGSLISPVATMGVWFKSDIPFNDASNMDLTGIAAISGTDFASVKYLLGGGGRIFQLETGAGGGTHDIAVSPSTRYCITVKFDKSGPHILRIYAADGTTLIGEAQEASAGTAFAGKSGVGQSSANTPTTGFFADFDSFGFDPTGTRWPYIP